jgi:SSS family solute:Na+ symporter
MFFPLFFYLLCFIMIGIAAAFQAKNPNEFYAAGKHCGFFQVTMSLLATILGSSAILGTISLSQKSGWAAAWMMLAATTGLLCLIPLAKYVRRYGNFTLTDMLGSFYGQDVKRLACIIIPVAWTGVIAAQIIGSGKIIAFLTPLSYAHGAILTGTIFIVYTVFGGQISIIKTDIWQGFLIFIGLAVAVFAAANSHGLPNKDQITQTFPFNQNFSPVDFVILLLTYATAFVVGPDIYSRLFCAKNERTATLSVILTAFCLAPVGFLLSFIGITGTAHSFDFLSQHNLSFIIAFGLLSAVISSADTTLLTAASTFSELFADLKKQSSIKTTRMLTAAFGAISIVIALVLPNIIQALLLAFSFFSGAFIVPTIAGLLGFRTYKNRVAAAVLCGGVLSLAGKILTLFSFQSGNALIIIAFITNAFILFSNKKAAA